MKSFLKAFVYAFQGIIAAIKTQRNFRIHLVAVIYVTAFSFFYNLSKSDYILLVLTFSLVTSLELVNTAVEAAVDICSPQYSKLAKIAKDTAAGAVLIAAIGAVVMGVILFWDINAFRQILTYYKSNFIALIGLLTATAAAMLFIVYPKKSDKQNSERTTKNNEYKN